MGTRSMLFSPVVQKKGSEPFISVPAREMIQLVHIPSEYGVAMELYFDAETTLRQARRCPMLMAWTNILDSISTT